MKPKNENQEKLFEQLKFYLRHYEESLNGENDFDKSIWRHQAYGMICLYVSLFPKEQTEIFELWSEKLYPLFTR